MAPTKKQKQIFEALRFLIEKDKHPTVREVGALVGLRSPATVLKHLRALEREGLITISGKSRGFRLSGSPEITPVRPPWSPPQGIPLLGRIAAGRPIEAVAEPAEEKIRIDPSVFAASGDLMALQVAGDSMIEAGILDGDYVIIRRQPRVEPGEIAAVEVDGEVTLKRWGGAGLGARKGKETGRVRLIAANARFSPIEVSASDHKDVRVLGKYVGLVRGELRGDF